MVSKKKAKNGGGGGLKNGDSSPTPNSPNGILPDPLLQEECKRLRTQVLKCPGVSSKSPALTSVLATLDGLEHSPRKGAVSASPFPVASIQSRRGHSSKVGRFLRIMVIDLPLLVIFATFITMFVLHHVSKEYLIPQLNLMEITKERKQAELTYYNRVCDIRDVTTTNVDDLIMSENVTAQESMEHMIKHGVSVYPHVLSPSTADELRAFIVERNKKEEGYYVIENKHRYSWGIRVDHHPIIPKALREIATHPTVVPALEAIAGPNPAVIEFTAITSEYGATDQRWHQDIVPSGSSFKHARTFFPSYSLFIPLQDTSAAMGATAICPGSHVCDGHDEMCRGGGGFQVSGPRDNWPRGYGALVNQHLQHRGTAHTLRGGPERVLFILTFAPRPVTDARHVETRGLSLGGSYSMLWSNWGHTLRDFGNAPVRMANPWRTLRALGLYKPASADWGWDAVSTASMRIVSEESGYTQDDLDYFLEEEGGFWFLPSFLMEAGDDGWAVFFHETVILCKEYAKKVTMYAVAAYFALTVLCQMVGWIRGTSRASVLWRWIRRLVIGFSCVALMAGVGVRHLSNTPWARNIRYGRSFRLEPKPDYDDLPTATLPNREDVLMDTRYHSRYLYSYNHIVDQTHPGNMRFNAMLDTYAAGYSELPLIAKRKLLSAMVEWVGQEKSRFLSNFDSGAWSRVSDERAKRFCHQQLMARTNPVFESLLTGIAYLRSETKFGFLRATALHRQHIPDLLRMLQGKLIDTPEKDPLPKERRLSSFSLSVRVVQSAPLRRTWRLAPASRVPSVRAKKRVTTLPPKSAIEEPFLGAWIEGKDIVEGKYRCKHNEWYRGTLVAVNAVGATYDVEYDDGDVDEGLPRRCIRPFVPYALGEAVGVQVLGKFHGGRIVKVHPDNRYDIQTHKKGLQVNVQSSEIRRVDVSLKKGARIEARFQGEGSIWYPGTITKVNSDGSYDVVYNDGDKELEVEPEKVRVALF